jgi:hypothetical protein
VSAILVSLLVLKVVAAVKGVVTNAFGSILFDFFYYNYSSNYITKPYRKYYGRLINRLGNVLYKRAATLKNTPKIGKIAP